MVLGLGDGAGDGWKEGATMGGNYSSGMDGSKKITKRYPGRGKCLLLWRISILGGAFKREGARENIYIDYIWLSTCRLFAHKNTKKQKMRYNL